MFPADRADRYRETRKRPGYRQTTSGNIQVAMSTSSTPWSQLAGYFALVVEVSSEPLRRPSFRSVGCYLFATGRNVDVAN